MGLSPQPVAFSQAVFDFPEARIRDFKYSVYNLTISPA